MKMNKIIIPAAMLAVGVALVGSVSSTLAWYQYSTKAQAAYIGTSIGQSESLEIQKKDGKWTTNLTSDDVDDLIPSGFGNNLIPITSSGLEKNAALPAQFYSGIETGYAGYGEENNLVADNTNIVQFTVNIRYKKVADLPEYKTKVLKLIDLTIIGSDQKLYKAIRVHFAAGTNYSLFARNNEITGDITTATYGNLDTDNDGFYDKEMKYEWEDQSDVIYGFNNTNQVANNANQDALSHTIGTLPNTSEGLAVTVTMWIEGWQKLPAVPTGNKDTAAGESPMWNPVEYYGKEFKVGMRFEAVDA